MTYYLVHSQSVPGSSPQELVCCACSAADGILFPVSPAHSHARKSGKVKVFGGILFEYEN